MIEKIKNKTYNLLRWSEKFFKTDMVYLFKGGAWLTTSKVFGSLTSLALAIAYAHLLSKEDYGLYKYILSIVGLLSVFALPGLNDAIYRAISIGAEGSFREALKIKFKWGLLAGLAGLLTAGYYFFNGNTTIAVAVAAASLLIPFRETVLLANPLLQGKADFRGLGLYNSIQQILLGLSLVFALVLSSKRILIFIVAYFVICFIADLLFYLKVRSKHELNNKTDEEMKNFSQHLSIMKIVSSLSSYIDKILLWHYFGAKELAIYSFAVVPASQLQSYLKSIYVMAFPKLAAQDDKTTKKTLPAKLWKFTFIIAIGIAAYIILAPFFYKILFPQYLESVNYSKIYFLTLLFFPQRLIDQLLIARAKKRALYALQFALPAVKILSMFLLVPFFGIAGAIYAAFPPIFAGSIMLVYFFRKL